MSFWRKLYEVFCGMLAVPAGADRGKSVTITKKLGSGFDIETYRSTQRAKLRRLCDQVVTDPQYEARDIDGVPGDETFCNKAFAFIGAEMGCPHLEGKLANELYAHMASGADGWRMDDGDHAAIHAGRGGFTAAAQLGERHGHVVVLRGGVAHSPSFSKNVPIVAHVGLRGTNGIKKVSAAFPVELGMPQFFIWPDPNG